MRPSVLCVFIWMLCVPVCDLCGHPSIYEVYRCGLCTCACWAYMLSSAIGWTRQHGAASALSLSGCQSGRMYFPSKLNVSTECSGPVASRSFGFSWENLERKHCFATVWGNDLFVLTDLRHSNSFSGYESTHKFLLTPSSPTVTSSKLGLDTAAASLTV